MCAITSGGHLTLILTPLGAKSLICSACLLNEERVVAL